MKNYTIKDSCYKCAYMDKSLPKGRAYKCFTKTCPVNNLSRVELDNLLKTNKNK